MSPKEFYHKLHTEHDTAFEQTETRLMEMGDSANEVLRYAQKRLIKHLYIWNRFFWRMQGISALLLIIGVGYYFWRNQLFIGDMFFSIVIVLIIAFFLVARVLDICMRVYEKRSGYDLIFRRLVTIATQNSQDIHLSFLVDIVRYPTGRDPDAGKLMWYLIKGIEKATSESYALLAWEQKRYIERMFKGYAVMVFPRADGNGPFRHRHPISDYQEPFVIATLNLYARVGETICRDYIKELAEAEVPLEFKAARNVVAHAKETLLQLQPVKDKNRILLRASQAPDSTQDLLMPVSPEIITESDLVRPVEEYPKG